MYNTIFTNFDELVKQQRFYIVKSPVIRKVTRHLNRKICITHTAGRTDLKLGQKLAEMFTFEMKQKAKSSDDGVARRNFSKFLMKEDK